VWKFENWKVDCKKLIKYLKERYGMEEFYYYAGIDKGNEKQAVFYKKLADFGYCLRLKEVSLYHQDDGSVVRKANCDVDLTFDAMRNFTQIKKAIFLTGDGDFYPLMKYFLENKIEIAVISSGKRTSRKIKQLLGNKFIDIRGLKDILEFKDKKRGLV
jgi:uncharacterized LabA/DUF88 family protein